MTEIAVIPTHRARLRGIGTLLLLAILFIQVNWLVWYYFDVEIDAQKLLAETTTGGIVGLVYGFLPESNKRYLNLAFRRTLDSAALFRSSATAVGVIAAVAISVNRTEIRWPAGQSDISIDGKTITTDDWTNLKPNSSSVWGSFLLSRSLQVGDFLQTIRFRPFVSLAYEIPEAAVYSSRGEYRHITRLLALSFYQLVENRFLQEAKTRFATDEGKKYVDLNAVSSIVELCFNGTDVARSGDKLLGSLQQQSPTSAWLPLLRSCLHYSRGEFDEAAAALDAPQPSSPTLQNASVFFRAVNLLRSYILKSNRGAAQVPELLTQAAAGFQTAAEMSARVEDAYFREIARGSANIFRGITNVYQHDNDKAHEAFVYAAESSYPEIKARSYSDLGYVALLLGSLPDANGYFVRSLEAAPNFPYARTNLGYVLLAEGRYDEARALFAKLVVDPDLRRESLRDVVLSELAIAHIDAERAPAGQPNPGAYDAPLKDLTIFNYEGTAPALLRLVEIRLAVADKIYMSHDYYGLEMFALAMYARAFTEARSLGSNTEAVSAAARAAQSFRTVSQTVDPRCFIFHVGDGFFKPVAEVAGDLLNAK